MVHCDIWLKSVAFTLQQNIHFCDQLMYATVLLVFIYDEIEVSLTFIGRESDLQN